MLPSSGGRYEQPGNKPDPEPERGSREHAIGTTLRNHRADLDKITDEKDRGATSDAMVERIDKYDRQHDAIAKELVPRIRTLKGRYNPLPKNDPPRDRLEKLLVAVNREGERRLASLSKELHSDLREIAKNAAAPYRQRERAFVRNVQGRPGCWQEPAQPRTRGRFQARQRQHQPGKDREHER
jgi:hypothetical protein